LHQYNFIEVQASDLENLRDVIRIAAAARLQRGHRSEGTMYDFWENCFEAMRFTCEAQSVISARLMLFASGAPNAAEEATRMISEKITAFTDAGIAAERALADGLSFYAAAELAYSPLQRCVRANSDRLVSAVH
jgi:hypothetical protein